MSDSCERCGYAHVKKDDDDDVCIVCLTELELEFQYESYCTECTDPLSFDDWANQDDET